MQGNLIYDRLLKIARRNPVSFHVPGHKNGRIFSKIPVFEEIGHLDLTELPETDNLHHPVEIIQKAQRRASSLYGSRESFFLVNGTTGGILSMISAVARPGDKILMQRDCHRSAYHAVALNQLTPVYARAAFSETLGRKLSVDCGQIEEALELHPDIKVVLVTSPSYEGVCMDIEKISKAVHEKGALLLVDSAHGAHLGFSESLPPSPLAQGADVVVQSTHKTLPAFTQGSLLHVGSERIDLERLGFMLQVYQSSSPSYLLMAGIDAAMEIMEKEGTHLLENLLGEIHRFSEKIETGAGLGILDRETFLGKTGFDLDVTKILLNVSEIGLTGFRAGAILREKFDIQIEMAGLRHVLLVASVANTRHDFDRASSALARIAGDKTLAKTLVAEPEYSYMIPEMALLPGEAFYKPVRMVKLEEAVGEISGEFVTPYPPGIPLVCPGERIPLEMVEYLQGLKAQKIKVFGHGNTDWENVAVIDR